MRVLGWNDPMALARALQAAQPTADRLAMTPHELVAMIRDLDAFDDAPEPPDPGFLEHVLSAWIALDPRDGEDRHDPFV